MRPWLLSLWIGLWLPLALPAATNVVAASPAPAATNATSQAVEREYQQLLADDDAAQAEVDRWIQENEKFAAKGAGTPPEELRQRIEGRFASVRKAYQDFLERHPDHAHARLAYGSFLNDTEDEEGAIVQWEKARELDPKNPAAWNNLANAYATRGPVERSFEYYDKAIELNPKESLYYHSLGNVVYLFRSHALKYYYLQDEQQVFDKALALYAKAQQLDPGNFLLASDIAQTYYGIRPLRTNAALQAWHVAFKLAGDETEREGVDLHLARVEMMIGRYDASRQHLDVVTNAAYADLKRRLLRNLEQKLHPAATNSPPPAKP